MELTYDMLTREKFGEWNRYVQKHKDGNINHLAEWSVILKKSMGIVPLYFFLRKGDEIVGLLPLNRNKGIFADYYSTTQGGILLNDEKDINLVVGELDQINIDLNSRKIILKNCSNEVPDFYEDKSNFNLKKPLPDSLDELWESIPSKRKNTVRKGLKNNLEIKVVKPGKKDVDEFYRIYARNYRDLGTPVKPKSYFYLQRELLLSHIGMIKIFYQQKLIGVMWLHHFKDEMADPEAASYREYFHTKVNDYMYYKAFEHALKKECTTFNMGRSQYNSGTYQFKKSWGEVKIMEIKEYSNRQKKNIEARKTEYHSLIKLWQKLPIGLTTFIGPYVRRHFNLE